jgi:tetratricopeptide (TPR) repeat protein
MKKYFRHILSIIFFCLAGSSSLYCQSPRIDSLLSVIKAVKDDTVRILTYHELFLEYEFSDDEKAKEYLNQALVLSETVPDKKFLADTYILFGYLAEDKGNLSDALKNYLNAYKINQAMKDQNGIAIALNNIGLVYYEQGNYAEALKSYLASLKVRELMAIKNPNNSRNKKGIASSYNNIGNLYYDQGNYPEALKNQLKALRIREELKEQQTIASSYHNLGNVYYAQGNYPAALKEYYAAMEINKDLGNYNWLAKNYDGIGVVYEAQGNYSEVLKNYQASLKIQEEIEDSLGIAISNKHIGSFLTKQKKYNEALKFLSTAKEIALKIGSKDCLKEVYLTLSHIDSARSDYRSAFKNHKLYILYSDSLDNEESRKQTIQNQMTFDFEKKEAIAEAEHNKELQNQELLARERSRKQNIIILFALSGLLLVLFFAGFIFRSLQTTRKQKDIIEIQKDLVEKQKKEVEHQKHIVEEHQKEIIDSITYAKRIQMALLPTERYIDVNLKKLNKRDHDYGQIKE